MAMTKNKLESLLTEAFPDAVITIEALVGDGDHYAVSVKSSAFQEKTRIQQHKMVYDALKGAMAEELHALAIKTEAC